MLRFSRSSRIDARRREAVLGFSAVRSIGRCFAPGRGFLGFAFTVFVAFVLDE